MLNISHEIGLGAVAAMKRFVRREQSTDSFQSHDVEEVLSRVTSIRDEVTADHLMRVRKYAILIAEQLGLGEDMQTQIYFASQLHDIGKLAIPHEILQKPGSFTRTEKVIMNRHTLLGGEMLRKYHCPYLDVAAEVALYHHERWDGSGYPYGLSGEAIPLSARIVTVCDVYDALRSRRPYKDSYSHDVALTAICDGDGWTLPEHFDPKVLAAFVALNRWFDEIHTGRLDA
jgi:putative two-component system response regulator